MITAVRLTGEGTPAVRKKIVFFLVVLSIAIAGVQWRSHYLHAEKPAQPQARKNTPVYVTEIRSARVYDSVEALGTANAMESVNITANVSDLLREIHFTDGQYLKQGDVIAVLEQRQLAAQLAAGKARLDQEERELTRLEGLLKDRAVPRQDYDQRLTAVEITARDLEAIEATLAYRTILAPFDGIAGVRNISVGALVQPGDVITTLDDISRIKLDFTVPSAYLSALKSGGAIEAEAEALPGHIFRGTIESVNTRVDPVTRSVLVRAILPNPDSLLRPGLLLRVRLIKNEREGLIVPEESILQRQQSHFLLVVTPENKVEERMVSIGARLPGRAEVTRGLEAGERVIVRGVNRARDGETVDVAQVLPPPPAWGEEPAAAAPKPSPVKQEP